MENHVFPRVYSANPDLGPLMHAPTPLAPNRAMHTPSRLKTKQRMGELERDHVPDGRDPQTHQNVARRKAQLAGRVCPSARPGAVLLQKVINISQQSSAWLQKSCSIASCTAPSAFHSQLHCFQRVFRLTLYS